MSDPSKHISRRRMLQMIGLGAVAAPIIAACTGAPNTPANPNPQAGGTPQAAGTTLSKDPVTLHWDTFRGVGTPWPDKMISSFKEKHSNVSIELRPIPVPNSQQEAYPKMYSMYAAGTLGDIFAFDPSHWEFYRAIGRGILKPIDGYVAADKYDLTQFYKPFIDFNRWEGKLWGLPSWGWTGPDGMLINELHFQEAGIAIPDQSKWTMDDIAEFARKLTKKSGDRYDRYGLNLNNAWGAAGLTVLARQQGGEILSQDGKKSTLNAPEASKAIKWLHERAVKDKTVSLPGGFTGTTDELFASGKVSMYHAGSVTAISTSKAIKDEKIAKLKALLLPKRSDGKHPATMRGGTWNTGSKSKNPDWAWQFIKHLDTKEGVLSFNTEGGNAAYTRPDVMADPFFKDNPNFNVFIANLTTTWPQIVPANFNGTEYEKVTGQSAAEIYLGKKEIDQVIKDMDSAIQAVLDQPA